MPIKIPHRALTAFLLFLFSQSNYAGQTEITFAYVGEISHSAYSGLVQGLSEANLQGHFLGQKYDIEIFSSSSKLPAELENFVAIVAAVPANELLLLHEIARYIPIFNLTAMDDHLRSACLGNILSIIPSNKMIDDAIKQWQQKQPDAHIVASAWHEDFVKFAARDLNKRYRKAFNQGMDQYAWAGWAAIRMVADTVARESITNPVNMLNYLKTNLSFDGQKGVDMNFRETGQLRQLLLIMENNELRGEAPVRGVSSDLDSLGIRECTK
ncbi:MAG: hypothetical protein ACI9SC_002051 [Gammaproteobacteria bacterium]|jgi:hypothetical protein